MKHPPVVMAAAWLVVVVAGCNLPPNQTQPPASVPPSPPALVATPVAPGQTPAPTFTSAPPITPSPSPTPDVFAGWRIEDLLNRDYGGGGVVLLEITREDLSYTQYAMYYESDGLRITGLVDIPTGEGPFPVIIVNHGYGPPESYYPGYDSAALANALARSGYITIMPDFRGYGGSDPGPNPFRIGYAIDVLNLIPQVESLPGAAPGQVGVIGHSMGGGVSNWPMVIGDEVDAIVLYAAMNGDIGVSWRHIRENWRVDEMDALASYYGTPESNPAGYAAASPTSYLHLIRVPVALHHSTDDDQVPYQWSVDLASRLQAAGKDATLYTYEGAGHTFQGEAFNTLIVRIVTFFDRHVRQP